MSHHGASQPKTWGCSNWSTRCFAAARRTPRTGLRRPGRVRAGDLATPRHAPGRARRAWAKRTGGGTPTTRRRVVVGWDLAGLPGGPLVAGRHVRHRRRCRRTARDDHGPGATRGCGPPTSARELRRATGAAPRPGAARAEHVALAWARHHTRPASASPRPPSRGWRTTCGPCRCPVASDLAWAVGRPGASRRGSGARQGMAKIAPRASRVNARHPFFTYPIFVRVRRVPHDASTPSMRHHNDHA